MEGNRSLLTAFCTDANDSSVTEGAWEIENKTAGVIAATFLLLLALIGLPSNLIVVAVILREKMYKDEPFVILLLNEVLCNLLLIFIASFFHIPTGFRGEFGNAAPSDSQRCAICQAGLMTVLVALVLVFTSALLSFDRFLFFYRPLRYDQFINNTRLLLVLATVWIISIIVAVLPLTGFGEIRYVPHFVSCYPNFVDSTHGYLTVIVIAIPLVIWLVFNSLMAAIVFKNIRAVYASKSSIGSVADWLSHESREIFQKIKKKRFEKEVHLTKTYFGIVFFTLLAWLPLIVAGLAVPISGRTDIFPAFMYQITIVLFFTRVVSDPVLNISFIKELRIALKNAVLHCCRGRTRENCGCCCHCGADIRDSVTLRRCPQSHGKMTEKNGVPTFSNSGDHKLEVTCGSGSVLCSKETEPINN